jgi:ATP-binding cassette subfamily F protein 3
MISVNQVSIEFSGTPLFSEVSFLINDRDRIGLVGKNGSGKTTLLRLIAGEIRPHGGEVVRPSGSTIGYLPQETIPAAGQTVFEEAVSAFGEIIRLKEDIDRYTEELSRHHDYDSKTYETLLHRLSEANERYNMLGGLTYTADIEKVLTGLGFDREEFHKPVVQLSSGWQMRVELAKILLRKPDVVLLDEPTNHLDIDSIQWLEDYLINYPGAVMLVSHDRAFLDNITQRTVEITMGKIYDYKASYSDFVTLREERIESQLSALSNQQRQVRQIERFIERFRYKNTKSRQVQSRIRMLNRMEEIEVDETDTSTIHLTFPPAPPSGKIVLEAKGLGKSYGKKEVLKNLDFIVARGEHIAFVGRNGEGKTTLLKIISGELDHGGGLIRGHGVKTGYYAQNQWEYLHPDKTVFETVDEVAVGDIRKQLRTLLGAFLFSGDAIDKKVKVLSGGEKSRLAFARILLSPVNLLVLDEPTNHLDMQSKDVLKNALLQYTGTLIIASHDRDFLQGLTTKGFEFRNGRVKEFFGDIYDYLEARKKEAGKKVMAPRKSRGEDPEKSSAQAIREKKKQLDRDIRKASGLITKTEEEIARLEKEIKTVDTILTNPQGNERLISSPRFFTDYEANKQSLAALLDEWEKLHSRLQLLQQERDQS